jgi:hypothetical protein
MRHEFIFNKSSYIVDEVNVNKKSVNTTLKWVLYENDYFFDIRRGNQIKIYVKSLDDKQEFYVESTIILEDFKESTNSQSNKSSEANMIYQCGQENLHIGVIKRESTYNARTIFRTFPHDSDNMEDQSIRFVVSRLPFSKIPIACFHNDGCVPDVRLPKIVGLDEELGIYFLLTEETQNGGDTRHIFKQFDTVDRDTITSRHLIYVAKTNRMKIEVKNLLFGSTKLEVKNHQTCSFGSVSQFTLLSAYEKKTIACLCGASNLNSIRVFLPNGRVETFRVYNVTDYLTIDDDIENRETSLVEKTKHFRWDQIRW